METNAETWSKLRACYMEVYNKDTKALLRAALNLVAPTYVPEQPFRGDAGDVLFADGSTIRWDWDNGDFEVNGKRLEYPWGHDDPLDFDYSSTKETHTV